MPFSSREAISELIPLKKRGTQTLFAPQVSPNTHIPNKSSPRQSVSVKLTYSRDVSY